MKLTRLDSLVMDKPAKPLDAALAIRNQLVEHKLRGLREEFSGSYKKLLQRELQETDTDIISNNDAGAGLGLQGLANNLIIENADKEKLRAGLREELHMSRLQNAADEVII
jgi:hypothetical protein